MEPEQNEVYPLDWRHWTPIDPANTPAFQPISIPVTDAHGTTVSIVVPSVTALSWNIASEAHKRALNSRHRLDSMLASGRADELSYNYVEDIMASAMFSVVALEAFANTAIHQAPKATYFGPEACYNDWYKTPPPNSKDVSMNWTRKQAEDRLSLAKKLGDVLPYLMNKPSSPILDKQLWKAFRDLQELRNRCVQHAHTWDRTTQSFWIDLLQLQPANYPEIAARMIQFFVGSNPEYWVNRRPKG